MHITGSASSGPVGSATAPAIAAKAPSAANRWRTIAGQARAYVALTKPRVIELLLVTTVPTMMVAHGGFPSLGLVLITLVGGTMAAGAANAFNCYLDRDIDQVMNRTRRRPLVTGAISERGALIFAWSLAAVSIAWFAVLVNVVSALLTLAAIVIYVVGYTMILKRRTPQNIVWGGVAGCMPVFIGWAAVTGTLSWAAVALFGIIFFWTPPHYWPLSIKFKKDYAAAHVPMLPVVAGERRAAVEMVGYTIAMVVCSLALTPLAKMSWAYGVVALVLGAWFAASTVRMLHRARHPEAGKLGSMKVFHASITYLSLLFIAIAVDTLIPW